MSDNEEIAGIGDREPSSGELLRQSREQQGLSLQEVAAKLHLHQNVVAALENDDAEQLPSSTYVRGYLHNYARLLGLDTQQVFAAYECSDSQHPRLRPPLTAPVQISSSDRPVKAITYLLTLGLVVLLLAWWQSRHLDNDVTPVPATPLSNSNEPAVDSAATTSTSELNTSLGYPYQTVHHPDSSFSSISENPVADDTRIAAPAPATSVASEPAAIVADPDPAQELPAQLLETLPEVNTHESDTMTPEVTATPDITAPDAPTTETAGTSEGLQLKIDDKSWIEIYDAEGQRLYQGLAKPGDTIQISGLPPLEVLLGYAPGVNVSYNGKSIDIAEYSEAGVARFQVGGPTGE